jgi:hypothetical protein
MEPVGGHRDGGGGVRPPSFSNFVKLEVKKKETYFDLEQKSINRAWLVVANQYAAILYNVLACTTILWISVIMMRSRKGQEGYTICTGREGALLFLWNDNRSEKVRI